MPAWDTSPAKEKCDAAPLLRAARGVAGRIPRMFITDGLERCHVAFKVFRTPKGPTSVHIRDTRIRNHTCSDKERLNGGLAGRFRYARGTSKESLIFRMAMLRHRSIRPHGGMACMTPAEAAGTDMRGTDRSPTPFRNAVSAA